MTNALSLSPAHSTERLQAVIALARQTRGFMPDDEGEALLVAALRAGASRCGGAAPKTFVEIGAWCGKSSQYLGVAAESTGSTLFSIDHHRGSEENQVGWEHHESDLVDPELDQIDTLLHWRKAISRAGLEQSVVGHRRRFDHGGGSLVTAAGLLLH